VSPRFLSLSLSSLQTSHHRFQQNEDDGDDDDNNVLIIIITVLKSKQPQNTTPKVLSLSLSLFSLEREQKAQKNKAKNRATKSKNQKKTEREIYLFPTNGGRDFVSLSLSFSSSSSSSSERDIREKRERSVLVSRRGFSLSLDARARSVAFKKNMQSIKSSLPLLRFFPKSERERATLSSSCVRGERTFGERNPKKEKQNLYSLYSFTLTQTDCLLADVVLTAALLSGIKPEADKVQAIFIDIYVFLCACVYEE